MKRHIYIIFLLGCFLSFGQPPVERNNAVTNSAEVELPLNEIERKDVFIQQSSAVQTMNDFFELHNRANSLPGQKNPTAHQQLQMNDFVKMNQREDAGSFEYNLSMFMAGNYDVSKKSFLDKAKVMEPKNQQVLIQSAGISYILNDEKTLISDLKQLAGQSVWNTDDFLYAKDVLTSIPPNGILITHGINDSYPILHLQLVDKYRKDVKVIAMHLLQSQEYRDRLQSENIHLPNSNRINTEYLRELCTLNEKSKLYLALTIPHNYFSDMEQYLYPIGVTFRYAHSTIENSLPNSKLWDSSLNKAAINQSKSGSGKQLSANYLPLLVTLHKYYQTTNNTKGLNDVKSIIEKIGRNNGNSNLLKDLGLNE